MTLDLATMFAALAASIPSTPAQAPTQADLMRDKRSVATRALRERKSAEHKQVLASVNGDDEKLVTIHLWEPRKSQRTMFARGYEKVVIDHHKVASINPTDFQADVEETDYVLVEHVCERAKHPKDARTDAEFEGRLIADANHGGASFFAPRPVVRYAKPVERFAPLGDFDWCERDETISRANAATHAKRKALAARKIRNVKESEQ